MHTLPHTQLQVPARYPQVTAVSELPTARGLVWVAAVEMDALHVGTFENEGNGTATEFAPYDTSVYGFREFEAFAASCLREGASVTAEQVMELLTEEYDTSVMVREVRGHSGTYVRQVSGGRTSGYAEVDSRPSTYAEQVEMARQLMPRPVHTGIAVTWEMWTGDVWQPLPLPPYD